MIDQLSQRYSGDPRRSVRRYRTPLPQARRESWILVVDDDALGARATARWIKTATGLAVRCCCGPEEARCWLRFDAAPAAMIVDFELSPGTDGVSLLSELREQGCDVPAAILTGAPEAAMDAVFQSELQEAVPVLTRGRHQQFLASWLEPLSVRCVANA